MRQISFLAKISLGVLAVFWAAYAAPIRVGIFTGVGTAKFWHTSSHTASSRIASILARPDTSNLGPNLLLTKDTILVSQFGTLRPATRSPSITEVDAFVAALDSLDVVIINNITDIGSLLPPPQRTRVELFMSQKGTVITHASSDSYGVWPTLDSFVGTRFGNHPNSDRQATLHLDTAAKQDPSFKFLNRGLPDTARFVEEWFSFQTDGDVIRANPGLRVTVNVDETSYAGGAGGSRVMGPDHPMSWYRTLPEGGRFFYTALGHRAQNYIGTGTATTPEGLYFLRRQLYNAILWAARVDTNGTVAIQPRHSSSATAPASSWKISTTGSSLTVSLGETSARSIRLLGLDGKQVASQRGGRASYTFSKLRSNTVYILSADTPTGRLSRLVKTP